MKQYRNLISIYIIYFIYGILISLNIIFTKDYTSSLFFLIIPILIHKNYTIYIFIFMGIFYMQLYHTMYYVKNNHLSEEINLSGNIYEYENYYLYQKDSLKIKFYKNNYSLANKSYISGKASIKSTDNIYNKINNIHYIGKITKVYNSKNKEDNSLQAFKKFLYNIINTHSFNSTYSAILNTMILGDSTHLSKKIRETFSNYGISHILCISGLHISSILLFGYFIFRKIITFFSFNNPYLQIISSQISILCSLILIIFYMLIAGGKISSIRAFSMSLLLAFSILMKQSRNIIENLIFIGLSVLIIFPYYILYPSYQLSFLSVYIILRYKDSRFIVLYLFLITSPVSLYHFNIISISSIIANLFIIPITTFLIMPLIIIFLIIPNQAFILLLNYTISIIYMIISYIPVFNIYLCINIYLCAFAIYIFFIWSLKNNINIKITENILSKIF